MATAQIPARSTFQGLAQVVRYNWPLYVIGGSLSLTGTVLTPWVGWSRPLTLTIQFGAGVAASWTLASLLVTFYVYDLSSLYDWQWLTSALDGCPHEWATFHMGLDEASEAIQALYPKSNGEVFDVYDAEEMTEPSIARARSNSAGITGRKAPASELPIADGRLDAAFLIFAAHEIRDHADRVRFFGEVRRSLRPGGRLILVEHLRDAWNFAAYGPGFTHFFSRREWACVASESGFSLQAEQALTPFVRCFVLEKSVAR